MRQPCSRLTFDVRQKNMSVQNPIPLPVLADRIVKSGGLEAVRNDERYLILFPLLEYPFPAAIREIEKLQLSGFESFDWSLVIVSALREDSIYWVVLALKWIENGFPRNAAIQEAVSHAMINSRLDQSVRHKAYKIFHTE